MPRSRIIRFSRLQWGAAGPRPEVPAGGSPPTTNVSPKERARTVPPPPQNCDRNRNRRWEGRRAAGCPRWGRHSGLRWSRPAIPAWGTPRTIIVSPSAQAQYRSSFRRSVRVVLRREFYCVLFSFHALSKKLSSRSTHRCIGFPDLFADFDPSRKTPRCNCMRMSCEAPSPRRLHSATLRSTASVTGLVLCYCRQKET